MRLFAATAFLVTLLAPRVSAQAGLGHLEDASTPPRGAFRLRAITVWSRFDARFTDTGARPLGGLFSADSLGSAAFPSFTAIESRVESASGSPFTLSLGRSRLDATAREEIVPVTVEYGVTDRLSVGIMMPVVRRRVTVQFQLDTAGGFVANVGPNLHRSSGAAATNNAQVQIQFANAATQLQNRINACTSSATAPGCASFDLARAQTLLQASQTFAADVGAIYGTATTQGAAFVPMSQSATQAAIAARVSALNVEYQSVLGTTANLLTQIPLGAAGPAGVSEFQRHLTEELGRDSIANRERALIGDVEVGVKFRAIDRPKTETRRLGLQLALASTLRFASGSRQSRTELADLSTGGGMMVVDSRGILDSRVGRFGLLAAGHFATSVRNVDTVNLASRATRWTELHVAPRWHFSEPFSAHAAFSVRGTDKEGGDQLVGGGVSFTPIATGSKLPIEMRFTHLEAIKGDSGRPRFFRDQIEVRLYYRMLKR